MIAMQPIKFCISLSYAHRRTPRSDAVRLS